MFQFCPNNGCSCSWDIFAMCIIPQGCSFISFLLDLAPSIPGLNDQITLDNGCLSDLHFWSKLLRHWNGISFFLRRHHPFIRCHGVFH